MTRSNTEYPPHVRAELYQQLMRLGQMALDDTESHQTEEIYYLEWLLELCEERRTLAKG